MLATIVAVSVVCAPAYCLGETGLLGASATSGPAAEGHGCCASSEAPVDSQPANVPGSDEGCQSCLFSAGMLDYKVLDGAATALAPAAEDLPLWLTAPVDVSAGLALETATTFKVPDDGPRYLANGRAQQARLCVFLI